VSSLALFILLAVLIRVNWTPLTHLDQHVAAHLHRYLLAHGGQLTIWRDISAVLSPGVLRIAAVVAAAVLFLVRREWDAPLVLAISVLGTLVLSSLTKVLVDRDRPHFAAPVARAAGQSYPSGHALTSFVTVVAILVVCPPGARRIAAAPAALVIAAVGFSRLILGVHYLSDVVGAWLLGVAWICVVVLVLRHSRIAARVRP
jgi:undecaprenyl-diphosphatase